MPLRRIEIKNDLPRIRSIAPGSDAPASDVITPPSHPPFYWAAIDYSKIKAFRATLRSHRGHPRFLRKSLWHGHFRAFGAL